MAIQTYITSTEANYFFNGDTNYTSAQKTNALTVSFGLVNDFVNPVLKIPVVGEWDGESTIEAPQVLKVAQGSFYQWVLERGNHGYTDELNDLYNATAEMLRSLTQNELSAAVAQTYAHEAGWHITSVTRTANVGEVYVRGTSPLIRKNYKIVISTGGSAEYVAGGTASFDAYRSDTEAAVVSAQLLDFEWKTVHDTFEIRFDGQWNNGDTIRIVGIPESKVDTVSPPKNVLTQVNSSFGTEKYPTRFRTLGEQNV